VSGFTEHFLDKYFDYRRRYVDYIAREAPARAVLANLCAAILWLLVAGAADRGGGARVWIVVFAALALLPTAFAALASRGLVRAVRDRRAVQERTRRPANGSPL
jgi:uncharacterized membrane-anchored protein